MHVSDTCFWYQSLHIDGLVQEWLNSIANAMELHLSFTKPSIYCVPWNMHIILFFYHLRQIYSTILLGFNSLAQSCAQYDKSLNNLLISDSCDLFAYILQGYFPDTGAIVWLPQCYWSNPEWGMQMRLTSSKSQTKQSMNFVHNCAGVL